MVLRTKKNQGSTYQYITADGRGLYGLGEDECSYMNLTR
jgi:hypothetical protein